MRNTSKHGQGKQTESKQIKPTNNLLIADKPLHLRRTSSAMSVLNEFMSQGSIL